jgi:hypothetical protein
MKEQPLMILIAGPYRSGTDDDPVKLAVNVRAMESYALPIYRAGHLPVLGEWFALPLVELAGSKQVGDAPFNEIFHPISERLLEKCDAVLRIGGASQGADLMVEVARKSGLLVFYTLEEYCHINRTRTTGKTNRTGSQVAYECCAKGGEPGANDI